MDRTPGARGTEDERPCNVVLVVMDALRADRSSLYGNPRLLPQRVEITEPVERT